MRTNNKHVKNVIISVYFILIVFAILLATVFKAFSTLTESSFLTFSLIVLGFAVLFFLVHFISKYFEYDSDGLKVKITNKGLLLSDYFNYREKTIEFEKAHLVAFKYKDYIFYKTLVVVIKPSKGAPKKSVFNVTLVSRKKRKYIKQSLSKMIKHNQKT
ncbi:hypothetical protein IA57_11865 [Mangrovimonas yunxiaonensis]|uniref:Uncharacterized protein n=1 Tax=Mangrovimonas yunxiaonensis TaxID=1197477 RepID=A0A084THD7_9FLAO|nr:hypothetical protein [Mangrovimonas yunxiaonensis]KFB00123.1 hypothetical protein IA57_11865 [Mangrovimonas yunxiaonensis]GGH42004.1 hypothetical protein GCM10011364_13240 [Mangrovimonas yunxiaonensis]